MSLSAPGVRLPRRIDTIERKTKGTAGNNAWTRRCAARRMEIARLYCVEGLCFKRIAQVMHVEPQSVGHAIRALMRRYRLKTHGQLGIWYSAKQEQTTSFQPAPEVVYSNDRADAVAREATEAQL
jgi:DNA-binding NarL/FixJ family response regulator